MEDKKEVVIPNWTMFGAQFVNLEIYDISDDKPLFNVGIGVILDDGKNDPSEDIKYITIFTSIFAGSVKEAVDNSLDYIQEVFQGHLNREISIYEKNGDITSIDIEVFLNAPIEESRPKNAVLH